MAYIGTNQQSFIGNNPNSITGDELAPNSIRANNIVAAQITGNLIALNTIGTTNLVNTGVSAGVYGGSLDIPYFNVDVDGRILSAGNNQINLTQFSNVSIGNVISSDTILTNTLTANTLITTPDLTVTNISSNTLSTTGNTVFRSIKEHSNEISISTNTITLDLNQGSVFNVYLNDSITGITVNNIAPAGLVSSWILVVTADGTARTISWPGQYRWPILNTPPSITSTADRKDTYAFLTFDGGSTVLSYIVAQST